MTEATHNKLKPHEPVLKLIFDSGDHGFGYHIVREMLAIQKEYNPNAKPVDTSCGNCVLELFKDVYRNYINYHP